MKSDILISGLNKLYPDARCELNYTKDYELLIATVLSAQCTDKRVNMVTNELFKKYDLKSLSEASLKEIEDIIRPCGTHTRKALYLKTIAEKLTHDYNGHVPNNRAYLESLPGVGHKTCNVVLSNIYDVPCIAVDTHVNRVSIRLGFVKENATVKEIEHQLMKLIPENHWCRIHHQLVLFGRYHCKAKNSECSTCPFKEYCQEYKKNAE